MTARIRATWRNSGRWGFSARCHLPLWYSCSPGSPRWDCRLSGFVAELSVLMGAWNAFPAITLVAVIGIPLAAAYTLSTFNRTFFAESPSDAAMSDHHFDPVTWPETAGVLLLLTATVYAGLCPGILIRWIHAGLDSTLMHGLTGGLS